MSCSPFDLRDYYLKELPESSRRQVEVHVHGCQSCREELERLRLTEAALLTLREEEIPQRIAFVSDKVFEPSWLRRCWQAFWASSARLGFASAAMLSLALLVFALHRPAPATTAPPADIARLEAAFARRLDAAVRLAVAESEARQEKKTAELLQAAEHRFELERNATMVAVGQYLEVLKKRNDFFLVASNREGGARP